MTPGITFDTGALIALERRRQRISSAYALAVEEGKTVHVPAVVVAEWWRGRTPFREIMLRGVRIEQTDTALVKLAGEAMAAVPRATTIDAIVMAAASRRGDRVYTSDFDDMDRLTRFFPNVRVLEV